MKNSKTTISRSASGNMQVNQKSPESLGIPLRSCCRFPQSTEEADLDSMCIICFDSGPTRHNKHMTYAQIWIYKLSLVYFPERGILNLNVIPYFEIWNIKFWLKVKSFQNKIIIRGYEYKFCWLWSKVDFRIFNNTWQHQWLWWFCPIASNFHKKHTDKILILQHFLINI